MEKEKGGSMEEQKDPREALHPQETIKDESEEGLKEYSFLQEGQYSAYLPALVSAR